MIYFVPRSFDGLDRNVFGIIQKPHYEGVDRNIKEGYQWCGDNGVFGGEFSLESKKQSKTANWRVLGFFEWLEKMLPYRHTCKFIVCPDVLQDAPATLARYAKFSPRMKAMGYPVAFVAQDGQENLPLPDDYDALFIGGSTNWKLGLGAKRLMLEAKAQGKWVHMGRVNSRSRIAYCRSLGIDSVDGTHVIYEPDKAIERIKSWMTEPNFEIALRSITEAQQQMVML